MFSVITKTIKYAGKAAVGFCRNLGRMIATAGRFVGTRTVVGLKAVVRFFAECFRCFAKSARGYFGLLRRCFTVKKNNGVKSALQAYREAIHAARSRRSRLISRSAIVAVPLAVMVLMSITAPVWANFTLAKRVVYATKILGDIANVKTYEAAKNYFIDSVAADNGASYLEKHSLETVYVMKAKVLTAESLAEEMLNNTDTLISGYGLYVDDQLSLISESPTPLYTNLYRSLNKSKNGNESAQASFVQAVQVREGYYPAENCMDTKAIDDAFSQNNVQLSIKTIMTEEYDQAISYSVNKIDTTALTVGKTRVVRKGKNGTNHISARVTYVDGQEVERVITDTQVVSKPVTQQMLIGTKKARQIQSTRVMLWPIAPSAKYKISSYYNESRTNHYHKGIDIACDKGTPIYAAMAGTVTVARSSSSYGKHIMISHGNNIVTVYAHCSALYVSAGDKVAKGEHIAAVGSTGRSTGNHLHFEVKINGKNYNPMNFVKK